MTLTSVAVRGLTRRPAFVRWVGFAGSVLLSIAAFVHGAFPTLVLNASPVTLAQGPDGALIYMLWGFGTAGLVTAWWLGRHLIGTGLLSARWVVLTAALWMLPMVICPPTGSRDVYAYACQGALVAAGHSPYHEGVAALPCQWLSSVSPIWRDTPAPYGPLFLMIAGAAAKTGSLTAAIVIFRIMAIVGVIMIAVFLPALARRVGVPTDRALWLVLACPLVVVHLIGGAHNDALTVGLLVAGLALLATRAHRTSALILGGVLIGLSIAVKTTIGAALPFAALFAAGGPTLPAIGVVVRRSIAVIGSALATLLGLSWGLGLGMFGWITALSHAGDSIGWTSPPTAVGLTIGYLERPFGGHFDAIPACRLAALVLLPVVLLVILWHSRNHNPLYGAGLALLATIFLAPVVQAWYLVWPLSMFAVTKVRIRWFIIGVTFVSCVVLPDGSGFTRILEAPMSFVVTGIVIWALVRGLTWLRGFDPKEIEFSEEAINGLDRPPSGDDEHIRAGLAGAAPAIAGARSSNLRSATPPDGD
jgi:hypothetical protein